ncbi:adenylate kinase 2, putative [Plasmodium ovale]|uniref:Adenylate kinase 2, putative n=2 Tax=Plasmodium ovale TaxID=36330 RepID=A0A1C3KPC5_PLAOA|nr:adenylate kinase 2, putative [Plasmodium ovale]
MTTRERGKMIYILNGAPGSGKDTQCRLIAKKYNLKVITVSELLKEHVKDSMNKGEDGHATDNGINLRSEDEKKDIEEIKNCINNGSLVSDDLVIKIVLKSLEKYMNSTEKYEGIVINGFPRTHKQGILFQKCNFKITHCINILVSKETLLKRIMNRIIDPITGINYNAKIIDVMEKKRQGILLNTEENLLLSQCDEYKNLSDEVIARLVRRVDDNANTFEKRFHLYMQNQQALAPLFHNVCKNVDGEKPILDIFQEICKIVEGSAVSAVAAETEEAVETEREGTPK